MLDQITVKEWWQTHHALRAPTIIQVSFPDVYQYIYQPIISRIGGSTPQIETTQQLVTDRALQDVSATPDHLSHQQRLGTTNTDDGDNINLDPNDQHNVHNITIVNAVKRLVPRLEEEPLQLDHPTVAAQISNSIDHYRENYPYALLVWKYIQSSQAKYSRDKIPELHIIALVWSRIMSPVNEEVQDTMRREFIYQLNDCYQTDKKSVWCLEGRVVRYFQVLSLTDVEGDQWTLAPLWYFKNEIQVFCSHALQEKISELGVRQQQAYFQVDPSPEDQKWIEHFNQQLIDQIDLQLRADYSGLLTSSQFEHIVKPCYQAIRE